MFADLERVKKIPHLLPILPVYFIIITVVYSFTNYFAFNGEIDFFKFTIILLFYINSSGVVIYHTLAMFTNPGDVQKKNNNNNLVLSNTLDNHDPLFCKKCNSSRPERAHHCKICNKCILKMDHHCPWIANCVGLNNQKFFYLFLFNATFGNLIAFICLLDEVFTLELTVKIPKNENRHIPSFIEVIYYMRDPIITMMGCFFAFAMTVAIGFLFVMQTKMILFNQTTIEEKIYSTEHQQNHLHNTGKSPWYDTDNKLENFKLVMGDNPSIWLFPIVVINDNYNIKKIECKNNTTKVDSYISLSDTTSTEYDDNYHINLNLTD